MKCGEDDDGCTIKVKFKYFLQYMQQQSDDAPLKVFDGNYDEDAVAQALLRDYTPPAYFRDDLFRLVGERRRPPYRWFLIGPKRSGTAVHTDPMNTAAWNTLLHGRKRWAVFPPHIAKRVVKGAHHVCPSKDDEPINWFVDVLPKIRQEAAENGTDLQLSEFVQQPGDTVYIPGGWWHVVLNLDDTVAVTQNYVSVTSFEGVWVHARASRRKMSSCWLRQLHTHYPQVAERAERLNARDRFHFDKKLDRARPVAATGYNEAAAYIDSITDVDVTESDRKVAGAAVAVAPPAKQPRMAAPPPTPPGDVGDADAGDAGAGVAWGDSPQSSGEAEGAGGGDQSSALSASAPAAPADAETAPRGAAAAAAFA